MTQALQRDLRQHFLEAMSQAASTVNVVTTDGVAGRGGVTVSAMAPVSADTVQPTLLICVHHESRTVARLLRNKVFCVNVLRDDQSYISDVFAGRHEGAVQDRFASADWQDMPSGAPRVVDPLVAFDCRVVSAERVGSHHVIFGEVSDIFNAMVGSPLIYANRAYGVTSRISAPDRPVDSNVSLRHTLGIAAGLGPVMAAILGSWSAVHRGLQPALIEAPQDHIREALRRDEMALALIWRDSETRDMEMSDPISLTSHLMMPQDHPLARQDSLCPSDLTGLDVILPSAAQQRERVLSLLDEVPGGARVTFGPVGGETLAALIAQGLGCGIVELLEEGSNVAPGPGIVTRPLAGFSTPPAEIVAVRSGNVPGVPEIVALMDIADTLARRPR